jgi:hypothetical protein
MPVMIYQSIRHHIPEDSNLHSHCHENLKSCILYMLKTTLTFPILEKKKGKNCKSLGHCSYYLGSLLTYLSSWVSQTASERSTNDPDWWLAASGIGTYSSSVDIPSITCNRFAEF